MAQKELNNFFLIAFQISPSYLTHFHDFDHKKITSSTLSKLVYLAVLIMLQNKAYNPGIVLFWFIFFILLLKNKSFCQFSWNSDVETCWECSKRGDTELTSIDLKSANSQIELNQNLTDDFELQNVKICLSSGLVGALCFNAKFMIHLGLEVLQIIPAVEMGYLVSLRIELATSGKTLTTSPFSICLGQEKCMH